MALSFLTLLRTIRKDKRKTAVLLVAGLAFLSLLAGLFGQFVILMLSAAAVMVAFFVGEFDLKRIGIELVTLTTVLAGFAYGPLVGMTIGAVLLAFHFMLARSLGPYVVYCVPMMGIIGLLAGYGGYAAGAGGWFGGDIAIAGIILSLVYNIVTAGLGSFLQKDTVEELVWSGSNFGLNALLFAKFAPIILSAMV